MKKNKIEEVNIVNEVNNKKNNKEYDKLFFGILLGTFFVIVVLLGIYIFFDKDGKENLTPSEDVEIKYSDVSTEVKPGIYITDVSEVVENVMPSIVSITSKTLVQSNSYFPWIGPQEYESVGAGSGIIISKTNTITKI